MLFATLLTFRDQQYTWRPEELELVEFCCNLFVLTPPIVAYYTNPVNGGHPDSTAVFYMASLMLVILGVKRFLAVAECSAVSYNSRNPCTGHGGCGVTVPLSSGVRHRIDHCGFARFVAKSALNPAAVDLADQASTKVY